MRGKRKGAGREREKLGKVVLGPSQRLGRIVAGQ